MKNTILKTISNIGRNLDFLDGFSKNPQISNFTKIRPVGTELFHAKRERRTYVRKLIVAFRLKTCPAATVSTANLTGSSVGSYPGLRNDRPTTNYLNQGRDWKQHI